MSKLNKEVSWSAVFESAKPIVVQVCGGDCDAITAIRAVSISSIKEALHDGGIDKDDAYVIARLKDCGVEIVREVGSEKQYVSRVEFECVCNDIEWEKEEDSRDLVEIRKALDAVVGMVSEMYVPLVQKDLLRKIAEKLNL